MLSFMLDVVYNENGLMATREASVGPGKRFLLKAGEIPISANESLK
jgi:hypothetical protein